MQGVNFNSGSQIQISSAAAEHPKAVPASLSGNSNVDTVSFAGGKKIDKDNSSLKQIAKTVAAAVMAAISYIFGKAAVQSKTTDDIKENVPEEPAKVETAPKASEEEAVEGEIETGDVQAVDEAVEIPDKTAEVTDEAQKEILEFVNGVEKEIQTLADDVQKEAKEIHADALDRLNELAEILKNDGKDSEGRTVGKVKYDFDRHIYGLELQKDDDETSGSITLEIGTNKVCGAFLRFEDGLRIDVNSDVISCSKKDPNNEYYEKEFFFNRDKNDELKAYMGYVPDSNYSTSIDLDFEDGKVAEYTEKDTKLGQFGTYPKHACFSDGEMVRCYENLQYKDGETKEFAKGFAKTFDGTWVDLAQEK